MHYKPMGFILGYDVGGTKISAVIGDETGKIHDTLRKRTLKEYGKEGLSAELIAMGEELLRKNHINSIDKVGIIFAGPVDSKNGIIVASPNIIGLKNFNIKKPLEDHFNVPVYLDNDAAAAAISERIFGSGKNVDNFIYITLSTGIGAGIFINGRLYKGSHGMAGEVGHMAIMPNGSVCGCGRRGCWETIASGKGIARRTMENITALRDSTELSKLRSSEIDAKAVFRAMDKGDMFAQLMVEETIYYIAFGIVNLINILDPELIIIGGGLSFEGEKLFKPLRMAIKEEIKSLKRNVRIVKALENGADIGSIAITMYYD
ncbi:ROK family protein [Picrophilus oshimae]|uniref:Glucokinase n=1 Tax=Picrophilus torridus (strain ATCC 700027 / DSM 9790 / JCM 10055 / NBRC 100828 / KAW 2/3) TaxID=1122961 RepID=A0A8G2FX51_PICTO|nr:ROK family protein [Picrophilus oshimae]SMD31131.1 glucokinase [Picrophilus oshimae DSM 9789]